MPVFTNIKKDNVIAPSFSSNEQFLSYVKTINGFFQYNRFCNENCFNYFLNNIEYYANNNKLLYDRLFMYSDLLEELPFTLPIVLSPNTTSTTLNGTFSHCTNLKRIELDLENKVSSIDGILQDCSNLESINIVHSTKIESIGNAFANCIKLTSVTIDDISNCKNFRYVFSGCQNLTNDGINIDWTNLYQPSSDHDGIDFRYMFEGCNSFTYFPNIDTTNADYKYSGLLNIWGSLDGMYKNCGWSSTNNFSIPSLFNPSKCDSVESAFSYTNIGPTVNILSTDPKAQLWNNITYFVSLFEGCKKVTDIDLSGITCTGYDVNKDRNTTSINITIGSIHYSKAINISFAKIVRYCSNLVSFTFPTIPSTDSNNRILRCTNFSESFYECSKIQTISNFPLSEFFPNFSYTFFRCSSLSSLTFNRSAFPLKQISSSSNGIIDLSSTNIINNADISVVFGTLPVNEITPATTISIKLPASANYTTATANIATGKGWTVIKASK